MIHNCDYLCQEQLRQRFEGFVFKGIDLFLDVGDVTINFPKASSESRVELVFDAAVVFSRHPCGNKRPFVA